MEKEKTNPDGLDIGHATPTEGAESMTALKDEVAKLTEENKSLASQLYKAENYRDIYKRMWSELDDKYNQLLAVTKETVKFAGLV